MHPITKEYTVYLFISLIITTQFTEGLNWRSPFWRSSVTDKEKPSQGAQPTAGKTETHPQSTPGETKPQNQTPLTADSVKHVKVVNEQVEVKTHTETEIVAGNGKDEIIAGGSDTDQLEPDVTDKETEELPSQTKFRKVIGDVLDLLKKQPSYTAEMSESNERVNFLLAKYDTMSVRDGDAMVESPKTSRKVVTVVPMVLKLFSSIKSEKHAQQFRKDYASEINAARVTAEASDEEVDRLAEKYAEIPIEQAMSDPAMREIEQDFKAEKRQRRRRKRGIRRTLSKWERNTTRWMNKFKYVGIFLGIFRVNYTCWRAFIMRGFHKKFDKERMDSEVSRVCHWLIKWSQKDKLYHKILAGIVGSLFLGIITTLSLGAYKYGWLLMLLIDGITALIGGLIWSLSNGKRKAIGSEGGTGGAVYQLPAGFKLDPRALQNAQGKVNFAQQLVVVYQLPPNFNFEKVPRDARFTIIPYGTNVNLQPPTSDYGDVAPLDHKYR
ncbi:hypothetical protein DdX_18956 [Ditylenchus destructor]|uniref:Uncharacterized protein n=1 Tax=Ditylenchus destructor TaxID=166010 RepID=A0AAD4MNI5_9BILA|nr:hypothetical protein DdX_18956 [Ditylenchus destructor]